MAFSEYSEFYDIYYADKDYAAEVDFVLELASRFGNYPKTVLDMGCGTGRHLVEFVKYGLKCDGFDLSTEMLIQARERLMSMDVTLSEGNLTDFRNEKQYDLVVSLFAVMGYLIDNEDFLSGLRTARKHLKPSGLFIFDGWFGPAVLAQQPEKRYHEYENGCDTIVRKVTPKLDPIKQNVTIKYEVSVKRNGKIVRQIREDHLMRFMFVQEMALAMEALDLELVYSCPFLKPYERLTTDTWNVAFVAQRKEMR